MATVWFVIAGALLIGVALTSTVLKRLPMTAAVLYLAVGAVLGPWGVGLLDIRVFNDTTFLEALTEIAVSTSLFTAGLKMRLPINDRRWRAAMLLASVGMLLTISGVAATAVGVLGLSLGAAVLLGAVGLAARLPQRLTPCASAGRLDR